MPQDYTPPSGVLSPLPMIDTEATNLTLQITPPVNIGDGKTYSEFTLREPTVGDMLVSDAQLRHGATQESQRNSQVMLISRTGDIPVMVVQKLPISTFNRALLFVMGFMGRGLPTGES